MTIDPDRPSPQPPAQRPNSKLAFAALALLALIWGYNWVVMKVGIGYSDPFMFAALRAFLGAVVLFPIIILLRRPIRLPAPLFTIILGILQTTGFVGLIMWALKSGAAGRTSVLVYTMPFWLLLMAWPVLSERIRGAQWLAVGLAFLGLILILRPWHLAGTLSSSLLAIAGGFCWGASAVIVKLMQRRYTVEILSFTAWQMLIGAIPLILVAGFTFESGPQWTGSFIAALAFNVLPANALAWLLWLYALRTLPAGTAGLGTLAIPVVGVLSAWIQLGERPSSLEAIGMLLIIGALAILTARELMIGRRLIRRGFRRQEPNDRQGLSDQDVAGM
ncbi:MAG: DMT family transporter [Actinobacteria bacterium]|nr:DMT family transporter [Actinomycetota bacterium]